MLMHKKWSYYLRELSWHSQFTAISIWKFFLKQKLNNKSLPFDLSRITRPIRQIKMKSITERKWLSHNFPNSLQTLSHCPLSLEAVARKASTGDFFTGCDDDALNPQRKALSFDLRQYFPNWNQLPNWTLWVLPHFTPSVLFSF